MAASRRIVVIGSNSFSGSDFIDLLEETGRYEIAGVSRSPERKKSTLGKPAGGRFSFHQIDLNRRMDTLLKFLDRFRPQYVANFAAQSEVAPSWENPDHWFRTNCVAFSRLVKHLAGRPYLKRYLHISTPEVYGTCSGRVREDAPIHPSTPYAVSRAAQDQFLEIFRRRFGFPVVSVRSANVYGPGQQLWKIIPRTAVYLKLGRVIELHGGGRVTRSFIHVRDVSRGELAALEKGKEGGIYHLSTEKTHAIRDVVRAVCKAAGRSFSRWTRSAQDRPGQDAAYILNTSRARRDLGWGAEITLEKGIRQVLDWVEENWKSIRKEPLKYKHRP